MNVSCKDRDRIFVDGTAAEWAGLEAHAIGCTVCAEELRSWKALSVAAAELRDYPDSRALWPRIHEALVQQAAKGERWWNWRSFYTRASVSWQRAAATAFVIILLVSGGLLLRPRMEPAQRGSLLKSGALVDVERAETAYVQAIEKLATEANPALENSAAPLVANYREKLMVLDSAIDDLRAQTGQNPSNAHLRYELLAIYQEKQRTLEEVVEAKR